MLSGEVLSRWLQHRDGTVLRGSSVRLSRSGLLRVSTVDDSRPVRVLLPVRYGGQAAVARAQLADAGDGDRALALRVAAVTSREEQSRQMERLLSMLSVVTAARERPETYPSVLPVVESFVCTVPGSQLGSGEDEHELWCDVMAWCGTNLAELQQVEGDASRVPAVVVGRMAPVVATVRAVHENLGVIHRDITPHNVLVDDAGRLLLTDWGIAHLIDSSKTSTHTQRLGNLGFSVPPETLRGGTAVGRYTDAWYLGALLVWQLTGLTPSAEHGPDWLPPGLDQAGEQLAVVARGLCTLDSRQRMGLPEAAVRLGRLVGRPGPAAIPALAVPAVPSLRTSDSAVLTEPAPGLPGTPGSPALSDPLVGPDPTTETVAISSRSRPTELLQPASAPVRHLAVLGPSGAAPPTSAPRASVSAQAAPQVEPPARPGQPDPPLETSPPCPTPCATGPAGRPEAPAQLVPGNLTPPSLWKQPRQVVGGTPSIGGQALGGPGVARPDAGETETVGSSLPADRPGYTVPYRPSQPRGRTAVVPQRPPSFAPPTSAPPVRHRGRTALVAVAVVAVVAAIAAVAVAFQLVG